EELQAEVVEEERQQPNKRGKKPSKFRRADITALRDSDAGTPSDSFNAGKRKALTAPATPAMKKLKKSTSKASKTGTGAFDPQWVVSNKAASARSVAIAVQRNNDDTMVTMGGFADDDDDDEAPERAALTATSHYPRNRKNVAPSNVKITRGRMAPTKTELRGGSKKWNENHLPAGAKERFKSEVVPMAKERTGILPPWANLSSDDLQDIVDEVYGSGTYTVEAGDAWHGLISYRIQNWRNSFAGAAMEAVKRTLEDLNSFEDAAARLVAVNFWLDFRGEEDEEIAPYQFKKCVEGQDKKWRTKGFCQSPLIIETFANAHFQWMRNPQAGGPADEKPIGALILSLQAVEHALREYEEDGDRREGSQ
ncbi:hypothetical protein H0H92_010874, partial [Tricholoma furcatifolium]